MIELKFGKLFRELKKKKGMKFKDMCKKADIDRMTFHRLKQANTLKDFNPTLSLIDKVCVGLGIKKLDEVIKFKKRLSPSLRGRAAGG